MFFEKFSPLFRYSCMALGSARVLSSSHRSDAVWRIFEIKICFSERGGFMTDVLAFIGIAALLFGVVSFFIKFGEIVYDEFSKLLIWQNYRWYRRHKGGVLEHWQMQPHIKWTLWTRPSDWPKEWVEIDRPALAENREEGRVIESENWLANK
jgi:hypothetical protein